MYVDDACDAFLRAGFDDATNGGVFNVGGSEPIAHRELVALLLEASGRGTMRFVEWPDEKRKIDIGSFYSDSTRMTTTTGWTPAVTLRSGLASTLSYYRAHFDRYVESPEPTCA